MKRMIVILLIGILVVPAVSGCAKKHGNDSRGAAAAATLPGDWYVTSTRDSSPREAAGHYYWHFDVDGNRFSVRSSCSGTPVSYGTIASDGTMHSDTSDISLQMIDGVLTLREMDNGIETGRTYRGTPVRPLLCDILPNNTAPIVARQTFVSRGDLASVGLSASSAQPSAAVAGAGLAGAVVSDPTDSSLVDHLRSAYTGTQLPVGTDYDGPQSGATPTTSTTTSGGYETTCDTEDMTLQQMENTFSLFNDSSEIYPGALLQGGDYANGVMHAITLSRAPITVSISGPTFTTGAQLSALVADPGQSSQVNQAIADLINQGVVSGVAEFNSKSTYASSQSQVDLSLGAAGSYDGFTASADFNFGASTQSSYLVYYYNQTFYSVSVPQFGNAINAFAPGTTDPPDAITGLTQIGAGNPPLYVSQVDYGRQILFEVKSTFSEADVNAAMKAAYGAGGSSDPVSGHASLTYGDVMANSTVEYMVRGGSDTFASSWTPIVAASGDDLFNQIKNFFSQIKVEPFTTSTPAVKIGFTLTYLIGDQPASMLYATNYTQTQCSTQAAGTLYSYSISANQIDDDVMIYKDGVLWNNWNSPDGSRSWTNQSLDGHLSTDQDHEITIKLYNNNAGDTYGNFVLYRDNKPIFDTTAAGFTYFWSGLVYEQKLKINRTTGTCVKTYNDEPGNSNGDVSYYESNKDKCQ